MKKGLAGFTMVELVAALSIFVIIIGVLYKMLDSATNMWNSATANVRERETAEAVRDTLADDLQQAVTDSGVRSNEVASVSDASFYLDSNVDAAAAESQAHLLLRFARPAFSTTPTAITAGNRLSLDMVCYTFYNYALFRHVFALPQDADGQTTLGERMDASTPADFTAICRDLQKNPTDAAYSEGSHICLARRICGINILAAYAKAYLLNTASGSDDTGESGGILLPVSSRSQAAANVLPDRVDASLCILSEEEEPVWLGLQKDSSAEAKKQADALGTRVSRRITFPAQGGSRL